MNILALLQTFGIAFLGSLIYFAWKARLYFMDGEFEWGKWKHQNLHRFIFATFLLLLVVIVLQIEPNAVKFFDYIGLHIDPEANLSPLMLGVVISGLIMGADKTRLHMNKDGNKIG